MRNKSEEYGAVVTVCRRCHNEIHNNYWLRENLKRDFQRKIMTEHNLTIDEFREIFKKNYF